MGTGKFHLFANDFDLLILTYNFRQTLRSNGRVERCQWQGALFVAANAQSAQLLGGRMSLFAFLLGQRQADVIIQSPTLPNFVVYKNNLQAITVIFIIFPVDLLEIDAIREINKKSRQFVQKDVRPKNICLNFSWETLAGFHRFLELQTSLYI